MTEIIDIATVFTSGQMGDTDRLVLHNVAAGEPGAVTAKNFLDGNSVARDGGDHNFGTSEIDDLTATNAEINELAVPTGLTVGASGATMSKVVAGSLAVAPADITAGSAETVTATLTGATTAMFLSTAFTGALPDGMICQAWISAANTVSFRFYNSTGSTITGASYTARAVAMAMA